MYLSNRWGFPELKTYFARKPCNVQTPVYTIASNAGVEGAVIVGKLLEQDNPDFGYDAAKGGYKTQTVMAHLITIFSCSCKTTCMLQFPSL